MVGCVAYGCTNRTDKKISGVTFHRFPKDADLRVKWTVSVRRENWKPSSSSSLCSQHFAEDSIDRTSLSCVRLRQGAVPTIFPAFPKHLIKDSHPRKPPAKRQRVTTNNDSLNYNVDEVEVSGNDPCSSRPIVKSTVDVGVQTCIQLDCNKFYIHLFPPNEPITEPQLQPTVASVAGDTPRKVALKRKLEAVTYRCKRTRDKLRQLQQRCRRNKKRAAIWKNIISDLQSRRFMEEDRLSILEKIPGPNLEFLKRQLSKQGQELQPKKYSPELRAFALTLHFYSPKAYSYVRKTFSTCLPHVRTVKKWYQSTDGSPGYTTEAFAILKEEVSQANLKGRKVICSLVMDEMAVRKHVEFDGKKYHGYVDMGNNVEDDSLPVAKEVLSFIIVAVTSNWKLPVGYFFIDGINSEQRMNLVNQCLSMLFDTGVVITSLTFDGASANLAMAKKMGCQFDSLKPLKTWFSHPVNGEPIYIFFDPCHMLKLVRNTLGDKGSFVDGDGNFILWQYIKKLHELQEGEGLHLGNKLRRAHIEWRSQKMKVKLATQLFSDSVADAIDTCRNLGFDGFEDSKATANFIRMINKAFDVFNSRSVHQKYWKAPLHPGNYTKVQKFLQDFDNYLLSLTVSRNGDKILQSCRKTGFLGFRVCIQSLLAMYDKYVLSGPRLKYLLSYKFSQDHIELFFGAIRSFGGCNNNPTSLQFTSAYKKMLVHTEIGMYDSSSGNCTRLEAIPILSTSSSSSQNCDPVVTINTSSNKFRLLSTQLDEYTRTQDHDYIPIPGSLSECTLNITVYIAGFVIRKLEKTLVCDTCIGVLRGKDDSSVYSLVRYKSKGGLIFPSKDVITVCAESERVFRRALACSGGKRLSSSYNLLSLTSVVLQRFELKAVFESLKDHMFEQNPVNNHLVQLIRAIAQLYLNTRFHYAGKIFTNEVQSIRIRNVYNKLVLFKGQ